VSPTEAATGKAQVRIHIGGVCAAAEPTVIKTLLGSCVAVCLFDPLAQIGGMNHFLLPRPANGREDRIDTARFGVHAMDCLIGALQKLGADRRRLKAKVFGGGDVLRFGGNVASVAHRNVAFIDEFLFTERVAVVARDVGGELARELQFHTDTGTVYLKRLRDVGRRRLGTRELRHLRRLEQTPPAFGDVTLFEP
jgi:chemotaxis protein CheD